MECFVVPGCTVACWFQVYIKPVRIALHEEACEIKLPSKAHNTIFKLGLLLDCVGVKCKGVEFVWYKSY